MAKRDLAGVCRFCGCSEFDPCPTGCAWRERSRTVCTECTEPEKAERQALRAHPTYTPTQRGVYHRGFVVGWFRITMRAGTVPYLGPQRAGQRRVWLTGQLAGAEARRAYERVCGPIENDPRARLERVLGPAVRAAFQRAAAR